MENKLAVKIQKNSAEKARKLLIELDIFDHSRKIIRNDKYVELPIIDRCSPDELKNKLAKYFGSDKNLVNNVSIVTQSFPVNRINQLEPFEIIYKKCSELEPALSSKNLELIPNKWEMLGDILIIKFPTELDNYANQLAPVYAEVLGAVTVLREIDVIKGPMRIPSMEILYGHRTETIHKENGVLFKFDAAKLIFSSGNIDERARIAIIPNFDEVIVDMFAGIGYFTLPIAVHSKPNRIYACELNPTAFEYLQENIRLNQVENIVEPILGDNRVTAPENVANRVILGYIKNTQEFLSKALRILKNGTGILHYHDTSPNELLPDKPFEDLKTVAAEVNRNAELLNYYKIKSYAPGVSHVVIDVLIKK
jgi:tRNA wybutosine-synthesizing protein 2